MVIAKRNANRREEYLTSLKNYCKRFAVKFPDLRAVTVSDVETFIAQFSCASSRQTWLSRISTMFAFAVKRGMLIANPCDKVERVTVDHPLPEILTVEQAKVLLGSCPDTIKPYLALAMFAGIRPDEILRMDWADVDLETRTVEVKGKTRHRRIVPLEDAAVAMLSRFKKESGRVAPSKSTLKRWRKKKRELIGGKWTADILRHTAASYLLPIVKDIGIVATRFGNSPKMLQEHYIRPVTREAAERFWSLTVL